MYLTWSHSTLARRCDEMFTILLNGDSIAVKRANRAKDAWPSATTLTELIVLGTVNCLSTTGMDLLRGLYLDLREAVNALNSRDAAKSEENRRKDKIGILAHEYAKTGKFLRWFSFVRETGIENNDDNIITYYREYLNKIVEAQSESNATSSPEPLASWEIDRMWPDVKTASIFLTSAEKQKIYDLVGQKQKIKAIKYLRDISVTMSIKEAKDVVDAVSAVFFPDLYPSSAYVMTTIFPDLTR